MWKMWQSLLDFVNTYNYGHASGSDELDVHEASGPDNEDHVGLQEAAPPSNGSDPDVNAVFVEHLPPMLRVDDEDDDDATQLHLPQAASLSSAASKDRLGRLKVIAMDQPLLPQIARMDSGTYNAWVHSAHVYADGRRAADLTGYAVLEPFTRTYWWMVPAVWAPVALYCCLPYMQALASHHGFSAPASKSPYPPGKPSDHATVWEAAALASLAWAIWTLTEYSIHRFIFHFDHYKGTPDITIVRVLHCEFTPPHRARPRCRISRTCIPYMYIAQAPLPSPPGHAVLLHGIHHKTPNDPHRLVLPPALTLVLVPAMWALYRPMFAYMRVDAFQWMVGIGLLGYVSYDVTHYWLHHGSASMTQVPLLGRWWSYLMRVHARHHALDGHEAAGFGISTPWWDWVMATAVDLKAV